MPDIATRKQVIRIIREFEPDLMLTHRPNDYHPDHRYASQLARRPTSYALQYDSHSPFARQWRSCTSPTASRSPTCLALMGVDITGVIDTKIAMVACHEPGL